MTGFTIEEYRNRSEDIILGEHRFAFWREGKGDFLLFIHGFPSCTWDWHHVWNEMKRDYTCIAIDLLGFGLSEKPFPYHYSIVEQADMISRFLDLLSVRDVHVVAHDYGDSVAQELLNRSIQHQDTFTITSMCFLNGGLFPEAHRPLFTQRLLGGPLGATFQRFMTKRSLQKSFTKIFAKDSPPEEEDLDIIWEMLLESEGKQVIPPLLMYLREREVHREAWVRAMRRTRIPLHFMNGVHDPISGGHMLERYKQLVPEGTFLPLNAGHYPQLEVPDLVVEGLHRFLDYVLEPELSLEPSPMAAFDY